MDLCPHGDYGPACLDCLEGPPPPLKARSLLKGGGRMEARYDGRCKNCDQPFAEGDPILNVFDVGWCGTCCATDGRRKL